MPEMTARDKPLPCLRGENLTAIQKGSQQRRKHIRLPPDAYRKAGAWYFITICCRNKKALFQTTQLRTLVRRVLCESARACRVELTAYTILPDHAHIICSAGERGLSHFIRIFKGRVTAEVRKRLGLPSPWQARFFDHKIRSEESHGQKCEYVWMNPVRRGLASTPEDYPWSGNQISA